MVNLNDRVSVRLTATGLATVQAFEEKLRLPPRYRNMDIYENDLWCGYVWQMMQIFGPSMHLGMGETPFVNNEIEIQRVPR